LSERSEQIMGAHFYTYPIVIELRRVVNRTAPESDASRHPQPAAAERADAGPAQAQSCPSERAA
jgi:hypothetical protein